MTLSTLRANFGFILLWCFAVACCLGGDAEAQRVFTVAGGAVGDGGPATSAAFANPHYIAEDRNGNLYISDEFNHRIRRVDVAGNITTVAGTGISGYSGDGGPAKSAMLSFPIGMVMDTRGNLLIADNGTSRVRQIDRHGIITTIAGNGTAGYSGDGGPATAASLNQPWGLAVDDLGNLYISDRSNEVIRKVDRSGIIHTVAGNGTAGFSGDGGPATSASLNLPTGLALDGAGNLYIADSSNYRIRVVNTAGTITTIAGNGSGSGCTGDGGPATLAPIGFSEGVEISGGSLLIATGSCSRVRAVDLGTQIITTIAGSSSGFNGDGNSLLFTEFDGPTGLLPDASGNLVIAERSNARVRKLDFAAQTVVTIAGGYIGDGGPGTAGSLNLPNALNFDMTGNLYIADQHNHRVRKVDSSGVITTFAGTGISGKSGDGGPAILATLDLPQAVAADSAGNVFIADAVGSVLRRVNTRGIISSIPHIFAFITSLAADSAGNLYAADSGTCVIWKRAPTGSLSIVAGVPFQCGYNGDGIQASRAWLSPNAVAADSNGNIFIADYYNSRVRKVTPAGLISTVVGTGACGFSGDGGPAASAMVCPFSVALDSKGNLFIADLDNARIREVNRLGTIQTLAGTGSFAGYNGNGLPAKQTNFDYPAALAVSPSDALYVDDLLQYRVRKIQ